MTKPPERPLQRDTSDTPPSRIGRFKIRAPLGSTSTGMVYDAVTEQGDRVALKWARATGDEAERRTTKLRFLREMQLLRKMNHPGVIRLVEAGEAGGFLFLALERVSGATLRSLVAAAPLDFDAIISLGIQLSETLANLHEIGVVHRNISPDTIIVDAEGRPILADMGLASIREGPPITRPGHAIGPPGYVAPEILRGDPPSPRADQYAVARLLFEVSTASTAPTAEKEPFSRRTGEGAGAEVGGSPFPEVDWFPSLKEILNRALAEDPNDRYPDMFSLFSDLGRLAVLRSFSRMSLARPDGSERSWSEIVPSTVFRPDDALEAIARSRTPIGRPAEGEPSFPWEEELLQLIGKLKDEAKQVSKPSRGPEREVIDSFAAMTAPENVEAFIIIEDPVEFEAADSTDGGKAQAAPHNGTHLVLKMRERVGALCERFPELARTEGPGPSDLARTERIARRLRQDAQTYWVQRLSNPPAGSGSRTSPEPSTSRPAERDAPQADRPPSDAPLHEEVFDYARSAPPGEAPAENPRGKPSSHRIASFLNAALRSRERSEAARRDLPPEEDTDEGAPLVRAEKSGPSSSPLLDLTPDSGPVARLKSLSPTSGSTEGTVELITGPSEPQPASLRPRDDDDDRTARARPRHLAPTPARGSAGGSGQRAARALWPLILGFAAGVSGVALVHGLSIPRTPHPTADHERALRHALDLAEPLPSGDADALFRYGSEGPPAEHELHIAKKLLQGALDDLSERRFDAAKRNLGLCIELADLARCHGTLGVLLAAAEHSAARAHLARCLELEPVGPFAERIRSKLAYTAP